MKRRRSVVAFENQSTSLGGSVRRSRVRRERGGATAGKGVGNLVAGTVRQLARWAGGPNPMMREIGIGLLISSRDLIIQLCE